MKATTTRRPRHKVPDGIYPSTLLNYQPAMTNNGLRYQFVFALDGWTTSDGEQITLMRTTSPSLKPQSHRRVILEALMKNKERHNYDDLFSHPEDKVLAMNVEYDEEDCARVKPSALLVRNAHFMFRTRRTRQAQNTQILRRYSQVISNRRFIRRVFPDV